MSYGVSLAESHGTMTRRRATIDERPGPLPDIRATGGSVTFLLRMDEIEPGTQLVIRCDGNGNAWVAIATPDSR